MAFIALKWFAGMVPRLGNQHLKPPHATEAENCNLYSGELRPLNRPALAHQFCEPGDTCFITPKPDDPSVPPPEPPPEPPACIAAYIITQPAPGQDYSQVEGGTVLSLSVTVNADVTAPVQYQWLQNNQAIAGQVGPVLTFILQPEDSYSSFTVFIRNPCGEETSLPVSVGEVTPVPICTIYECDALETAIISTGPLIYYIWNGTDTGTTPSTWVNQGSASVIGQHLGSTGRYTDDPASPYIDPCTAGLFPFKINSNAGAQAKELINNQLWIGGAAAGENCTYGCLLNVFDNKVSWASGLTSRLMFTSQAYAENTSPYEYASYSVWLYPNTGRVRLKMMTFQPFGSIQFFYPDVYIDPDLLFDGNGDAKNVMFTCHVQRHVATQTVDIKVWVDGSVAASQYGIYNTFADTGNVFQNNDGSKAGLDGSGLEICSDGPSSDNGGGTVIFSHQWVALGESPQTHIDTIAAALPRNYLSYTDPNPNCRPPA